MIDKPRIEAAVKEILAAIGEDPERDGLQQTPRRIAEMYDEIFAGLQIDHARLAAVRESLPALRHRCLA